MVPLKGRQVTATNLFPDTNHQGARQSTIVIGKWCIVGVAWMAKQSDFSGKGSLLKKRRKSWVIAIELGFSGRFSGLCA